MRSIENEFGQPQSEFTFNGEIGSFSHTYTSTAWKKKGFVMMVSPHKVSDEESQNTYIYRVWLKLLEM